MRFHDVPGVDKKPYFVSFKVESDRNPEKNSVFQHQGHVEIEDFMRIAYWINLKNYKIFFTEKKVVVVSGKDRYTITID